MIKALMVGFATTLRYIFTKPITVNYPEQKVPVFPKYRGKQVLMRDENGLEKCVACGLCAVACPADAIYLEAAENDGTVQAGPRYAKIYQIHKTRCIFCGYCEEACPVSAIFMGKDYELAVYSKNDFIWDKQDLLVSAELTAAAADMLRPFLDEIDQRVLVCDGAMGTMLYSKGVFVNRCFESLNLSEPDLVAEVHLDYVRAGADVLETNTFGANRVKLVLVRPGRPGAGDQHRRARGWPGTPRASRPTWPAPSGRSASGSSRGARPASTRPRSSSASRRRRCSRGGSTCSSSRRSAT